MPRLSAERPGDVCTLVSRGEGNAKVQSQRLIIEELGSPIVASRSLVQTSQLGSAWLPQFNSICRIIGVGAHKVCIELRHSIEKSILHHRFEHEQP